MFLLTWRDTRSGPIQVTLLYIMRSIVKSRGFVSTSSWHIVYACILLLTVTEACMRMPRSPHVAAAFHHLSWHFPKVWVWPCILWIWNPHFQKWKNLKSPHFRKWGFGTVYYGPQHSLSNRFANLWCLGFRLTLTYMWQLTTHTLK